MVFVKWVCCEDRVLYDFMVSLVKDDFVVVSFVLEGFLVLFFDDFVDIVIIVLMNYLGVIVGCLVVDEDVIVVLVDCGDWVVLIKVIENIGVWFVDDSFMKLVFKV